LEFRFGRSDPLLIELLREALDRLGNASASLRAKLLARLAAAEQPALDSNGPVTLAFEAIALAKELPDRDRLAVMYVATAALVDYVQPDRLEVIHREVLALARGSDRTITVHTRLRLCFTALERLDRKGFDSAVEVYVAEAVALGLPQWTRHIHMLSALTALLEGRFEDDRQATSRSEAVSMTLGDNSAQFIIDVHRSMSAWVSTTPLDAKIRARITTYVPGRAVIEAWLGVQDGNRDATRTALGAIDGHVTNDPDLGAMVGTAVAFAGDRDQAAKTYEILAPRQNRIALTSMVGCAVMDLYDRVLLVLATTAKNWDVIDRHAERALAIAHKLGSPVWAARVQADWADALVQRANPGDSERAADLRQQAFDVAQRLGMPGLMRRWSPKAVAVPVGGGFAGAADPSGKSPEKSARVTFSRHGELWVVSGFSEKIYVKDSRGIQMIAQLTDQPDRALHALDLSGGIGAADGGDAGPALDHTARAEYRSRLNELAQERDEAESLGDRGRIERANQEIEALSAEIERAFGLAGRERKVGGASERARSNVQRRISHGIEQIRAVSPRLGEHLAARLHTGTYCVYRPG
jgi:hypothetical protein